MEGALKFLYLFTLGVAVVVITLVGALVGCSGPIPKGPISINLPCDHKLVSAVYEDGKVHSSIRARRPGEPMVKNTLMLTFVDGTTKEQAFLIESVCRS